MSKSHSLGTCRCARPPGITIPGPAHCRMQILDFFLFPEDFYAYSQGLRGAELKKQAQAWFQKQSNLKETFEVPGDSEKKPAKFKRDMH